EVAVHTDARKLGIADFGLAETDLADLDERQNTEDWFEFDSKQWTYRLSREAQPTSDRGQVVGFYYWDFQEGAGSGLLTVRKAEGEPFTATLYAGIAASNV